MLTDVMGVLDKEKQLIPALSLEEVRRLMEDGTISGGMIPKLETCVDAVEGGVEAAVILDGRVPHALLLEIFTRPGVGTLVSRDGTETGTARVGHRWASTCRSRGAPPPQKK